LADTNLSHINSSCWQFLAADKDEAKRIQRETDSLFADYSFYPEVDWSKYGYFPPDGHLVIGAWRHPDTIAFVFLLDNRYMQESGAYSQFLIYAIGLEDEISSIDKKIAKTKKGLRKEVFKAAQTLGAASRLDQMTPNRSIGMFTGVLTFVTALINAFSYYLRTLPPPKLFSESLDKVYLILLSLIHFLSLGLLIIVTVICALFLFKYAFVLLKKL
jgi:hypothetical protein